MLVIFLCFRQGLLLRQVTDGSHFIQLIYSDDGATLRDCEYLRRKDVVQRFLDSFRLDVERARAASDPDYIMDPDTSEENALDTYRNATFRVLDSNTKLPTEVAAWLDYGDLKETCKRNHRQIKELVHHKQHGTSEQRHHAEEQLER